MDKKRSAWWSAHKPTRRRLIQVYAALLYNANLKGFIEGKIYTGATKNVCVPGFNCYSCPGAVGACPLGALQNALASSGNRAPYYVLGILLLFGLTLGRTICGWLCPLGMIQELFYKIPTPKLRKSRYTRVLSWLKYVVLAVFVVAIPLAYSVQHFPVPAFCKYICPAGTSEGAMALLSNPANADKFSMLGILFTRKFIIMVLIFTACVFVYRAFCRFLCPLGAIYGLFSRLSIAGVRVEVPKCTHCGLCVSRCKMDIRRVGDHECIHCGECIDVCPTKAIRLKCGKITLMANEAGQPAQAGGTGEPKARKLRTTIAWVLALALLAGALWYYNRPTSQPPADVALIGQTAGTAGGTQAGAQGAETPDTETQAVALGTETQVGTPGAETQVGTPGAEALDIGTQGGASGAEMSFTAAPDTATPNGEPLDTGTQTGAAAAEASFAATPDAATPDADAADALPVGSEVGMRCPDFAVPLYAPQGGTFTFPTGKATVINFWATWCTPCVGELPHFQKLFDAYGDRVALVAIHSNLVTDDVQVFLDREGYTLPFALDESGSVIQSLGGSTMLPMTVIVDQTGKIVYNKTGSVTYELLESLISPLV